MEKTNFVTVAIGDDFAWLASLMAKSLKQAIPNSTLTVFSDHYIESALIDNQIEINLAKDSSLKTKKSKKMEALVNFEENKFFFVDSDIFFARNFITETLNLDYVDIAVASDTWRSNGNDNVIPHFNTGVMFLNKSDKVQGFLESWYNNYITGDVLPDQISFNELFKKDFSLSKRTLSPEMNFRCAEPFQLSGFVNIIHNYYGKSPQNNLPALSEFINSDTSNRVWVPQYNCMYVLQKDGSIQRMRFQPNLYREITENFFSKPVKKWPYKP